MASKFTNKDYDKIIESLCGPDLGEYLDTKAMQILYITEEAIITMKSSDNAKGVWVLEEAQQAEKMTLTIFRQLCEENGITPNNWSKK